MAKKAAKGAKAPERKAAAADILSCDCDAYMSVGAWILIMVGVLGFLEAWGFLSFGTAMFGYVWSLLVLAIGILMVIKNQCNCK